MAGMQVCYIVPPIPAASSLLFTDEGIIESERFGERMRGLKGVDHGTCNESESIGEKIRRLKSIDHMIIKSKRIGEKVRGLKSIDHGIIESESIGEKIRGLKVLIIGSLSQKVLERR
jgi:hypothetical protein